MKSGAGRIQDAGSSGPVNSPETAANRVSGGKGPEAHDQVPGPGRVRARVRRALLLRGIKTLRHGRLRFAGQDFAAWRSTTPLLYTNCCRESDLQELYTRYLLEPYELEEPEIQLRDWLGALTQKDGKKKEERIAAISPGSRKDWRSGSNQKPSCGNRKTCGQNQRW